MANFSALKTAIQNAIRQNGNEEITGNLLQQILLSVVNTMGDGAINTIEQNLSSETLARQNGDNTLQSNINAEALARGNADTQLQNAINAIKANIDNGYVYAGIATSSSTPVSGKVFYIAIAAGTYTNFGGQVLTQGINILRFNGSAWSNQQLIGIDDEPKAGSNNLVKSGGVQNELALGAVYDVSAKNPTAGPNSDGKWESLSALLSDANLSTLIPAAYRKGGMSIKFVQSSDNKYVQYRLMAQTFSTTLSDWQGVDDKPIGSSDNLVKSGGVYIKEAQTSVRVDDIEAKVYELAGHGTDTSIISSLLLDETHSAGYSYLNSPIPNNKTITAVRKNGEPYNGTVYIGFSNNTTGSLDTANLPLSFNRIIDRVYVEADVPQHIEFVYTEPSTDGIIHDIQHSIQKVNKSLITKESYQDVDLYSLPKDNYIFRSNSYIDENGDFQSNNGFASLGFYSVNLLEITCKVGNNNNSNYAIAFYSSESVFDSTTLISEGSVKSENGIQTLDIITIPNNAKVVWISNRAGTLPYEQMELSLKYEYQTKEDNHIKESIKLLNSISQTEQDLYVKTTNGSAITRGNKFYQTPLFCKKGDTVKLMINGDASTLLANNTINCCLVYSDGTFSSWFEVNNIALAGTVCEKDTVAIAYYKESQDVIGTGVLHLIAKVEATNVRTKVETITVANNQGFDNLNYIVNAKAGECIDIRFNTEETTFEKIVLYWYEPNSIQRQSIAEIKPNANFRLYCPYPVDKIGFYAPRSEGSECTVDIVTSVHKGDMLTIPSWYTEDYLLTKENRIKELIDAANGKVITFAFVTDEHIDNLAYNCKAPALIKHLCDNVNIDVVVNGGDISNGKTISMEGFLDALEKASENSLLLNVVGNHDYMGDFTDGKLYRYLYKNNYARYGNPARGYYYVDNEFQKVRFVILNAFADNGIAAKDGYEAAQVQWFTDEALNTPSDWKVIVFAHCFYIVPIYNDSPYYPYLVQPGANNIIAAIEANNEDSTNGKVLMCVQGHTHNDRIMSTTVTDSVPVVITTSDAVKPNLDNQDRPDHNAPREIGRISEQAFDVFVVNLETNTANIVRIGAQARDGVDSSQGNLVEERIVQL